MAGVTHGSDTKSPPGAKRPACLKVRSPEGDEASDRRIPAEQSKLTHPEQKLKESKAYRSYPGNRCRPSLNMVRKEPTNSPPQRLPEPNGYARSREFIELRSISVQAKDRGRLSVAYRSSVGIIFIKTLSEVSSPPPEVVGLSLTRSLLSETKKRR